MWPIIQVLRVPRCSVNVNQSRNLTKNPKSMFPSRGSQSVLPPYNHITQIGDPVLRVQCDPLDPKDIQSKEIQSVISSMKFTLKRYDCVGVSAPQVGVPAQLMMVQFTSKQMQFWSEDLQKLREMEVIPYKVLINPKLQVLDKSQVSFPEGCTSMYGFSALVPRYKKVKISGLDENSDPVEWTVSGWTARVVQHEFDHLQGKMFIDRADMDTLTFDYWNIINNREGDFRLGYDGIKPGPAKFFSNFFRQK